MKSMKVIGLSVLFGLWLGACTKSPEAPKSGAVKSATQVTLVSAQRQNMEIVEEVVGWLEAVAAPQVAAEVAGRVVRLTVDVGDEVRAGQVLAELDAQDAHLSRQAATAEVARLQPLLTHQELTLKRMQQLVQERFLPQSTLDEAQAQRAALTEQLAAARTRVAEADRVVEKARIVARMTGKVVTRSVAVGDFVTVGKPLFQISSTQRLRAHLPFPEHRAARLTRGQTVRLRSVLEPERVMEARIDDMQPSVETNARTVMVLVDVPNPGRWLAGGSVIGQVLLQQQTNAVVVPEESVVLRPVGEVVYVAQEGKAEQRLVKTGERRAGQVEILEGLNGGESIVRDGAAFLTDKASIVLAAPTKK